MKISIKSLGVRSLRIEIVNTLSKPVEVREILFTKPTSKPFLAFILVIALIALLSPFIPIYMLMVIVMISLYIVSSIISRASRRGKMLRAYPVRIMLRPRDVLNLSLPIPEGSRYLIVKSSAGTYTVSITTGAVKKPRAKSVFLKESIL